MCLNRSGYKGKVSCTYLKVLHDACSEILIIWSWVNSTSLPGSKESSTGLVSKFTNAFLNNCLRVEETDQLIDGDTFLFAFGIFYCHGGHSTMLSSEMLLLLHATMYCLPPSFFPHRRRKQRGPRG